MIAHRQPLSEINQISELSSLEISMSDSLPSNINNSNTNIKTNTNRSEPASANKSNGNHDDVISQSMNITSNNNNNNSNCNNSNNNVKSGNASARLQVEITKIFPSPKTTVISPHQLEQQESNLLDSTIKQPSEPNKNTTEHHQQLSKNNNNNNNNNKPQPSTYVMSSASSSSRQIVLQAQIIQLQLRCNALVGIINQISTKYNVPINGVQLYGELTKLCSQSSMSKQASTSICEVSQLCQSHQPPSYNQQSQSMLQSSSYSTTSAYLHRQLQSYTFLEQYVQTCRNQLQKYQRSIHNISQQYQHKIGVLQQKLSSTNKELQIQRKNNKQMSAKNQSLIIEIEVMQDRNKQEKQGYGQQMVASRIKSESLRRSSKSKSKTKQSEHHQHNNNNISQFNLASQLDLSAYSKYTHRNMHKSPSIITGNSKHQGYIHQHQHRLECDEQSLTTKDYRECQKQMEAIIDKLARTLASEIKIKQQYMGEVARLCEVIKCDEIEIKKLNTRIYQLEKDNIRRISKQFTESNDNHFSTRTHSRDTKMSRNQDNRDRNRDGLMRNSKQKTDSNLFRKSIDKMMQSRKRSPSNNNEQRDRQSVLESKIYHGQYYDNYSNDSRGCEINNRNGHKSRNKNYYNINRPQPSSNYQQ